MNRLAGAYEDKGYERTLKPEEAEVILMASCAVTQKAESEFSRIYSKLRREHRSARFEVTGCVGNAVEIEPGASYVSQEELLSVKKPFSFRTRPEVVIQTGCDNFCSYCIVPYKRGREQSRSFSEIISDVEHLISNGAGEIVLTGVHIGRYRGDKGRLAALIKELKKTGIFRMRLSSLDAAEIDGELLEEIGRDSKVARFIHIPLQHTQEKILKLMRREAGRKLIESAVSSLIRIDGMRLGADIIYGFPGEDENDFSAMLKSLEELPITHFHFFPYSSRSSTLASYFEKTKFDREERHLKLKDLAAKKRRAYFDSLKGRRDFIIVERIEGGCAKGKSSSYVNCSVRKVNASKGDVLNVRYVTLEGTEMVCEE